MTTRSNVVQYESNLSTNCSNTDLAALAISFLFLLCQHIDKKERKKREFFVIFLRKKKRRRERTENKRIKEREKRLITSYRLITIGWRGASALFPRFCVEYIRISSSFLFFSFLIYLLIPIMFSQCQKEKLENLFYLYKNDVTTYAFTLLEQNTYGMHRNRTRKCRVRKTKVRE